MADEGFDAATAPDVIDLPSWDRNNSYWEAGKWEFSMVGLAPAKNVAQVHGADSNDSAELRKKLRRPRILKFFTK